MTLIDYMAAGGEVVTDKISAYVDKDVFNNLLKMFLFVFWLFF